MTFGFSAPMWGTIAIKTPLYQNQEVFPMQVTKKRCVAMLLAGGQGSRLGVLTRYRAKPAMPFGGKYRIIDFPLSNCTNSGIDTVGVLTQYEPLELNTYIGTGAPWDLDAESGGAFILPPYVKGAQVGEWYSGTANAIYQNIYFIDRYKPEYLLVLSGDHIYKMDYRKMIDFHEAHDADVTIAALRVTKEEASRFGIMNTDETLKIVEFEEKPKEPKSDLASMGIYVFSWAKVREYLKADAKDEASSHDFGKNVLPAMLAGGAAMYAYPFDGYWKDVGTIDSLWEANMELLDEHPRMTLRDPAWKIYSRSMNQPPHYTGESAKVEGSLISEGCSIYGEVSHSVLFPGVVVKEGACVKDSVIMAGTVVGCSSRVERAVLDEDVTIGTCCTIGGEGAIAVVGGNVEVTDGAYVKPGEAIPPKATLSLKGGE